GSIQLSFSLVYHSRVRILATAVLNEQMEIIHNAPFDSVGIINGSPSGVFEYTTTTIRNGMKFEIIRTIRNVDDPFDGLIGGTPADTAPNDYKFVQIEARCISCDQAEPLSMYTYIAPKYLEGNLNHGALFVQVIDAYGNPVPGASVTVIATSTNPTYNFVDTTDNSGFLRIYDLATGTAKYFIQATKTGYTTDKTYAPSSTNPNPTTPHVTIIKQAVSNLTLTIDQISNITIETKNAQCNVVPSVPFQIKGSRLIGANPSVYLVNQSYTTDGSGIKGNLSLPWDIYGMTVTGYDLLGTIPDVPMTILPGAVEAGTLIVGSNTTRSLVVMAEHQGAPIANATVTITGPNGFSVVKNTGVGSISQTDWSQGGNIENFGTGLGYSSASGIDALTSPGNLTLSKNGSVYVSSGYLESSTIDTGENARYIVWSWNPMAQSPSTTVRLQIATSPSSTGQTWVFVGPDGTESTYFTDTSVNISDTHDDERYMRYRVYLDTIDSTVSPLLSDLTFVYTNACTPPGQVYAGNLAEGEYTIHIEAEGYQDHEDVFQVTGDHFIITEMTSL
ncbi:MAG TPA: carboxypeptidase-like regulatory domain-containing protein, partial [Candidatus Magasanikbacteria bacterium]|nr:carboxypeptidase-like regulatory domain-containing protein [Candidatus Magasanikbacteria bacterium]